MDVIEVVPPRGSSATAYDISSLIQDRNSDGLRALINPILSDVTGLKLNLPKKALTHTLMETGKKFIKTIKELVAACRAKASGPKTKGQFSICVVTPSSPRASSLCGALNRGGVPTAKVFSRHLSVEEQTAFLAKNIVDVAVGTPGRLAALANAGALDLGALRFILVDCTPDDKSMTFFSKPPKGADRRQDADELAKLLRTAAFQDAFAQSEKRVPALCPVLLPPRAALESSMPVAQRMSNNGPRGQGRGGGRGRGGSRGPIDKSKRPRLSAWAMKRS